MFFFFKSMSMFKSIHHLFEVNLKNWYAYYAYYLSAKLFSIYLVSILKVQRQVNLKLLIP